LSASPDRDAINCLSVAPERIDTEWKVTNLVFGIREVFSKLGYRMVPIKATDANPKIVAPGGRVIAVCKLATGHPI